MGGCGRQRCITWLKGLGMRWMKIKGGARPTSGALHSRAPSLASRRVANL